MSSIVAIVGRPNVGKSTLFNRLIQKREAIVDSQSGVTRDRHYGFSYWNGKDFTVIDTGGYMLGGDDNYEKEINGQVMIAIEESDVIIFTRSSIFLDAIILNKPVIHLSYATSVDLASDALNSCKTYSHQDLVAKLNIIKLSNQI